MSKNQKKLFQPQIRDLNESEVMIELSRPCSDRSSASHFLFFFLILSASTEQLASILNTQVLICPPLITSVTSSTFWPYLLSKIINVVFIDEAGKFHKKLEDGVTSKARRNLSDVKKSKQEHGAFT